MTTISVAVVNIPLLTYAGRVRVRIRTDAGASRHSVVAVTPLAHPIALVPGVDSVSAYVAKFFDDEHPNVAGAVVWCGVHNYVVYGNWCYSINSAASPAAATHAFAERFIGGVWTIILLSRRAVAAGEAVTVYKW